MSRKKAILLAFAVASAIGGGIYYHMANTPHVQARIPDDPASVRVEEAPDTNIVQIEHPHDFKLAEVTGRPVQERLNVTGTIAPDVSRTVPVVSLASGRVVQIYVRLGDYVEKGQLMLTINSPDLAGAFSDYQKAVADETLAGRQLDRENLLFSHGAAPQKDVQAAEDTEEKAKVDVRTTAQRIQILGGDADHPTSIIEVRAPVSGVLVEQNVTGAAGVKSLDNSPNLFTIADLSHIWVLCDVFENDLEKVRLGQSAEIRMNAYPERRFYARVSNIGQVLDPNTRAAKVRLELENPNGMLRPNMFGTITFFSDGKVRPVIPATAVLQLHDKSWIFFPAGTRAFRRQEIQLGSPLADGYQEVIAGVKIGDQVVVDALALSAAAEAKQ
jgi:cobalt-zinc-cadmium efflux system membrane fusion protein